MLDWNQILFTLIYKYTKKLMRNINNTSYAKLNVAMRNILDHKTQHHIREMHLKYLCQALSL